MTALSGFPEEPKLEMFLTMMNIKPSKAELTGVIPPTSRLTTNQYDMYLACHSKWRKVVRDVKVEYHNDALLRRAYEQVHEKVDATNLLGERKVTIQAAVLGVQQPSRQEQDKYGKWQIVPGDMIGGKPEVAYTVTTSKKGASTPTLSTKPEKVSKREARKAYNAAKINAAAATLQHKSAEVAASVDTKAAIRVETQGLTMRTNLWKAEERAAASAAKRAKSIVFGSSDLATNVSPEDGWKVVTRKKGSGLVTSSKIQFISETGQSSSTMSFDPAMKNGPVSVPFTKPSE